MRLEWSKKLKYRKKFLKVFQIELVNSIVQAKKVPQFSSQLFSVNFWVQNIFVDSADGMECFFDLLLEVSNSLLSHWVEVEFLYDFDKKADEGAYETDVQEFFGENLSVDKFLNWLEELFSEVGTALVQKSGEDWVGEKFVDALAESQSQVQVFFNVQCWVEVKVGFFVLTEIGVGIKVDLEIFDEAFERDEYVFEMSFEEEFFFEELLVYSEKVSKDFDDVDFEIGESGDKIEVLVAIEIFFVFDPVLELVVVGEFGVFGRDDQGHFLSEILWLDGFAVAEKVICHNFVD